MWAPKSCHFGWCNNFTAFCRTVSEIRRFDAWPRNSCTYNLAATLLHSLEQLRTHRSLTAILSAVSRCVIVPSRALFNQSRSSLIAIRSILQPSAVNRGFLLCPIRNFSLCRDNQWINGKNQWEKP
jgi:hypothetical protein